MNDQKPASILIVDDVPANLNLLSGLLREHGYRVRPAPSGKLALDAARHTPPDLVLLDINMPEMNGFEVCNRLKADPALFDIPVLFISAMNDTRDKLRAFNEGGQDYITKPFQVEEVLARVKTHLTLRRTEFMLKKQNDELKTAMNRLKKTQNQLIVSEKMAALGVMAAGVAHEINNPVNFIKNSCHGLEKDVKDLNEIVSFCLKNIDPGKEDRIKELLNKLDYNTITDEIPELLSNILDGLERTKEIVRSLRVFARIDAQMDNQVDLHEVVDSVLIMLRSRYRDKARIIKKFSPIPPVKGNAGKLSQVVINILNNAIDAVEGINDPEKNAVIIKTEKIYRSGLEYAALTVTDQGPGISDEDKQKIFDPFFTTKPVGKGTGLGLFICSNLIQEHDGSIEVSSTPGKGASFSIYLPVKQEIDL